MCTTPTSPPGLARLLAHLHRRSRLPARVPADHALLVASARAPNGPHMKAWTVPVAVAVITAPNHDATALPARASRCQHTRSHTCASPRGPACKPHGARIASRRCTGAHALAELPPHQIPLSTSRCGPVSRAGGAPCRCARSVPHARPRPTRLCLPLRSASFTQAAAMGGCGWLSAAGSLLTVWKLARTWTGGSARLAAPCCAAAA